MSKQNVELVNIITQAEIITSDIANIIGCLESLENSIYFSTERKDRDISKANSVAAEAILTMVNDCFNKAQEIYYGLKSITDKEV